MGRHQVEVPVWRQRVPRQGWCCRQTSHRGGSPFCTDRTVILTYRQSRCQEIPLSQVNGE